MDQSNRQHLKLAFVLDYAMRIVHADGVQSFEEFQMLEAVFPRALLREAGFLDEKGRFTSALLDHRDLAKQILPGELQPGEREEIFDLLYQACVVDTLEAAEVSILMEAGLVLGFEPAWVTMRIGELAAGV